MNNKKYMALFILLFITLLSCAVITAADTTNNVTAEKTVSKDTITQKAVQTDKNVKNINTEKTKTIEKKVTNNKKEATVEVEANDYAAMYNYVDEAKTSNDEYVIKLTGSTDVYTLTDSIVWNPQTSKLLTINGNGKTIDANNMQFLTIAQGNSVTINNLTVKNAKATNGAAIYNSGTLVVENSTFVDNSVTKKGGAIYSDGTLTVTNTTFNNNKVTEGKNSVDDGGAAIFTKGKLVVKNSTFEGNAAKYVDDSTSSDGGNGGAIQALDSTEDFIILDSTFKNNEGRHGGAIIILDNQYRNLGNKTIAGCNFTGNKATYGGAIETYATTNISNCKFEENGVGGYGNAGTNSPSGGAILINGGDYSNEVNIEECEFIKNSALNQYTRASGQGSAVYIYSQGSDVKVDDCNFTENSAYTGGTIYVRKLESALTVKDSKFTGNTVETDGVTISPLGSISVENVVINGIDVAGIDGTGNLDTNVADYAALYNLIETIKTTGMTENITATLTGTDYTETQPIVIDSTFKPELLTINGNGKVIDANKMQFLTINAGKNVTLNNLTVKNAKSDIGAAVINHGSLNVTDSVFENNEATSFGGAIYSDANLTVNRSTFTGNFMSTKDAFKNRLGGGAITSLGNLTIDNSTFTGNYARHVDEEPGGNGGYAGAIYVLNTTDDVTIINSYFTENNARHGGAITVYDLNIKNEGTVTIEGNRFYKNSALYGGAINSFHSITINNNNFTENYVSGSGSPLADGTPRKAMGGALCLQTETAETHEIISTVTNNNFTGNEAKVNGQGGAIKAQRDTKLISEGNTYEDNKAATGGAIQYTGQIVNTFREATFTDDKFTNNQANTGSVIYHNNSITLDSCTINDNPVVEGGYLITNDDATSLTFKDNVITHEGPDLINNDVDTAESSGNQYAAGNVVVTISPISDVTIIDTEEKTNIPVTLTIDEIYGITSMDGAQIKVTVNEDVQNAYSFPVSGTGSTIAIPVSDLSANNAVVVELVSDSGIYTLTPESLSFNIQKLITTQLSVNAADIYAGGNVNISGTLQKDGVGLAEKTITLLINNGVYTVTTNTDGIFEFTDLELSEVASEVEVTAKFVETGYNETTNKTNFEVKELPPVIPTTITVDTIENDLHVGDKISLTADVKDLIDREVDGGFVIFKLNGKTLRDDAGKVIYVQVDNGKAQLPDVEVTQEWAKEGSKIQAYYTGMDNYDISVSSPVNVSVVKNTAVVDVSDISGVAGQNITIKATVTSNGAPVPVGRVAIKIDGKTLKDANGKALYVSVAEIAQGVNYTLPAKIKEGPHTLSIVFSDPTFDRATDSATLTVSKEQT